MSSTATSTGITSQIWQRVVRQGDTNGDNSLSKDEFEALRASFRDSADLDQIIHSFDANGDGSLSSSELPSSPLDVDMLGPMLDWQEYRKADAETRAEDDKQIVASLFERADVDRDGFLSDDEMKAEATLWRTRWLEGETTDAGPVFMIRRDADPNHLSPEDFSVGRLIPHDQLKVIPPENIPPDIREALQKAAEEWKNSPDYQKPLTKEEHRQNAITGVLSTPLNATYISRLLSRLSAAIAKSYPTNTLRSDSDGTVA